MVYAQSKLYQDIIIIIIIMRYQNGGIKKKEIFTFCARFSFLCANITELNQQEIANFK